LQIFIKPVLTILISFALCSVFLCFLKKQFLQRAPQCIPSVGGISIGIVSLIVCFLVLFIGKGLSHNMIGILASSFIMLLFGIIDDIFELSIVAKFIAQIFSLSVLIAWGIRANIVGIGVLLNLVVTFLWVLGVSNAFNHLDVMDGLAGMVAMMVSFGLLWVSIGTFDIQAIILLCALIGALWSFLIYNFPPAKVYLGNAGSHFLGFIIASLALLAHYAPLERKIALLSPLAILGFPVFDTAFVIVMRLRKHQSPFKKSDDHLALRLLKNGYTKKGALIFMASLCIFFVVSGIVLSSVSNIIGLRVIITVVLVSLCVVVQCSKIG